ncbi:MAG TPA: hypothetical protein DDZ83_11100 [Nitrospinae bacterium]|nr:hypothetical protein [Nitrospinota bacterium]
MIQPRRGQVCPGSMIFVKNFNYGFIGHSVRLSFLFSGPRRPSKNSPPLRKNRGDAWILTDPAKN